VTAIARLCLVGAVAAPLVGAGAMTILRGSPRTGARLSAALHWTGVVLAGLLVILVAVHGALSIGVGRGRHVVIGLTGDRLTMTLVSLVLAIGAVVQTYSLRYLRTDPRAPRFVIGAGVLVSAMAAVAASTTLVGVVVGWVVASLGFVAIVGYRPDLPGVRPSARRTAAAFVVGDGALVVGALIVAFRVGNVALVGSGSVSGTSERLGGAGPVVALLIVVAALARCAQGPFGAWLPGTVAAPTPVSALLHAGFVNGGGILLVRTGAIASGSSVAMIVAFVVAAATAVVATAAMAQRSDVKSELAFSTMGQMGFMVAECTVGAFGAGVVHLIGHALYKATLFLGSGSQMPRPGQVAPREDGVPAVGRIVMAGIAASASVGVVLAAPGISGHRASGPLAVFVAVTAGVGAWSLWASRHPGRTAALAGLIVAASALYGLGAAGLFAWVDPSLPRVGSAVLSPWLLLAVAAGGALSGLVLRLPSVGVRLRTVLVDLGAPSRGATRRVVVARPASALRPRPHIDPLPLGNAA